VIRDLRQYRLIPITPIHIGDGNELDPTQYVIRGHRLERFDPVAIIAALGETDRRNYIRALSEGDLFRGQKILQGAASRGGTSLLSLLSESSARELQRALEIPSRRGSFKTMVRSGGRAIVPGSTLKGALRTGLLHLENERRPMDPDRIDRLIDAPGHSGLASDELQRHTFAFPAGATERDPMRDVAVVDTALEENATQIDRVVDWKRGTSGDFVVPVQQFQLHVERTLCLADQLGDRKIAPASVSIAVTSSPSLARRRRLEQDGGRPGSVISPNFAQLLHGANAHHVAVWKLERQRFFSGPSGNHTVGLLDACVARLGMADLDALAREEAPSRALIRMGWAGHFESKSIAAVRRGYRPQATGEKTAKIGSTRHGVVLNGVFVPFGWAALVSEETAPAALPAIAVTGSADRPPPRATGPGGPGRRIGTPGTSPGSLLFRKGDRVRNAAGETATVLDDVRVSDTEMTVDIDGDLYPEKVSEWSKM
jgi:CRISPR-associated protein Csm5